MFYPSSDDPWLKIIYPYSGDPWFKIIYPYSGDPWFNIIYPYYYDPWFKIIYPYSGDPHGSRFFLLFWQTLVQDFCHRSLVEDLYAVPSILRSNFSSFGDPWFNLFLYSSLDFLSSAGDSSLKICFPPLDILG